MGKNRLEAFSDGVIAIIITIMVLEFKVPQGAQWNVLRPLLPIFIAYVLSFIYIAIYWNNHHHMLHAAEKVNGKVLWANMYLLFWLSFMPFVTAWLGENYPSSAPVALYGFVQLMAGMAYFILVRVLVKYHGHQSKLALAMEEDYKGMISIALYALAVGLAWVWPVVSCLIYVLVAVVWFVPDSRVEKVLNSR